MSKLSEREVDKRLAEHARREGGEPPPELLARLRRDIPPAVAAAPELPETGRREIAMPAAARAAVRPAPRRWLIAATLAAAVGAGVLAVRVMETTFARKESWAAGAARLQSSAEPRRDGPVPSSAVTSSGRVGGRVAESIPPAAAPLGPLPVARSVPASPPPAVPRPGGARRDLVGTAEQARLERQAARSATDGVAPPLAASRAAAGPGQVAASAGAAKEEIEEKIIVVSETPLPDGHTERAKTAAAPGGSLVETRLAPRSAVDLQPEPRPGSYARVRRALLEDRRLPSPGTVSPGDLVSAFAVSEPPAAAAGLLIGAEGAPSPISVGSVPYTSFAESAGSAGAVPSASSAPSARPGELAGRTKSVTHAAYAGAVASAGERYLLRLRLRAGQAGGATPQAALRATGPQRLVVAFNPAVVARYRLLGAAAGKPSAGESIALYELELQPGGAGADRRAPLATLETGGSSGPGPTGEGPVATVPLSALRSSWDEASAAFRLSAVAAELGAFLSGRAPRAVPADLARRARELRRDFPRDSQVAELIRLIERTAALTRPETPEN